MWTPAGRENPLAEQSHRKRQISEKGSPSCVRRNIDLPLSFSQIVHPIWDFTVPLLCFSIIVEERSSSLFQKKKKWNMYKKIHFKCVALEQKHHKSCNTSCQFVLQLLPLPLYNRSQWNRDTGGGTEAGQRCSLSSFTLVPRAKAALFQPIYGSEGSKDALSLHRMCVHSLSSHSGRERAKTLAPLIGI